MDPRHYVGKTSRSISTSNTLRAMTEFCHAVNPKNPAATRVAAGLRSLAAISQALGKGGKLPVSIDNVGSNTRWVLDMLGINSQTLYKMGQGKVRDPVTGQLRDKTIADATTEAAQTLFDRIKNGQFTINDIPLFQPQFEAGYQVSKMDTEQTFNEISSAVVNKASNSPYAVDLDKALPKYKFLFVVQFTFNNPYMQDSEFQRKFAFVIKRSSRPTINYNMEDVNYYNFRTKVVTKAELDEMVMQFYDDGRNSVQALYTAYTQAMSPVLNYQSATEMEQAEMEGMIPNRSSSYISGIQTPIPVMQPNSASTMSLVNDNKNIIREIKLYHVYDNGQKVNIYTFINPRIISFQLDELDMALSEVNMVEMKFNYDSVNTQLDLPMYAVNFPELTSAGLYPLQYVGTPQQRGLIDYGNNQAMLIKRNSCLDDATSFVSSVASGVADVLSTASGAFSDMGNMIMDL